jgi:NAD(P)-dependent dehydrogenase (short-subunit alcohol dehydrogenase family)
MDRVRGKVALITGGAIGLGRACALLLAREGADIAVTDVKSAEGRKTAEDVQALGRRAIFLEHDVRFEDQWERVVEAVLREFGRLDIVANNAGVGFPGTIEDCTEEEWRRMISINLDGVFFGTKHAVRAMKKAGNGGSIINFSSIEGIIADANTCAYNASKGGVRLLTKSAALHCAKSGYGIRVNSIHPGFIKTQMVETYLEESGDAATLRQQIEALHPVGHMGEPDDIANGVLYLASDESKFMTGAELVIDGGFTAQ